MSARRSLPRPPARVLRTVLATAAIGGLVAGCGSDESEEPTPRAATPAVPSELRTPGAETSGSGGAAATPSRLPGQGAVAPQTPAGEGAAATTAPGAATPAPTTAPPAAGATAGAAGADAEGEDEAAVAPFRPFNEESPWNTRVDDLDVDPRSDRYIEEAQLRLGVVDGDALEDLRTERRPIRDSLYVNSREWTVPLADATRDGQATRVLCRQINLPPPNNGCGDGWQVPELVIPRDVSPVPENDGWFTVVDRPNGVAYDLWRARRSADGGTISYQFLRKWDLNGPGFLPPTVVAARGSGLPLFAGLILPEEIAAGRIEHALSIAVPGPAARFYVQPAAVTNGNGEFTSLPEGARIRLRDDVSTDTLLRRIFVRVPVEEGEDGENTEATGSDEEAGRLVQRSFPGNTSVRAARTIINALREYGAIVIDRAATPTLFAQRNYNWNDPLRNAAGLLLRPDGLTPFPRAQGNDPQLFTPQLRGSEVAGIRLSDFEVVELPERRLDPPVDDTEDVTTARLGTLAPQGVTGTRGAAGAAAPPARSTTTTTGSSGIPGVGGGAPAPTTSSATPRTTTTTTPPPAATTTTPAAPRTPTTTTTP